MKKKILALVLAVTLVFLLCGCDALDQLRQQRALYDGGKIIYQGVTYKLLPACDELQPEIDSDRPVYATTEDVPLLLITTEAHENLYLSKDGNFLLEPYSGYRVIYCREDMHGQVSQKIRDGWEYTKVYYEYMVYTEEDSWDFEMHTYMLTQEQVEALEFLTENVEPQTLGEGMSLQTDWGVYLSECSEDSLFHRDSGHISVAGSTYYLVLEDNGKQVAFQVPEGMVSVFDEITEAYRSAYDYPEADQTT